MIKVIFPAVLATVSAITVAASPATAQTGGVSIGFADLDLTTVQGRATLDARLNTAARQACASVDGRTIEESRIYEQCLIETREGFAPAQRLAVANATGERMAVSQGAGRVSASR